MSTWYIKGETGKTLDATLRTFESLNLSSVVLRFQSMASDTLCWTAPTENATAAGTIVPDLGQVVELWKDGVRKFKGHAVAPRIGMQHIEVTIEGPWWWMTRIPIQDPPADGASALTNQPAMVFQGASPTSYLNLTDNLEALHARATSYGVPMALGTFATTFGVPKITLDNMDCASALAELLRWAPDAVVWFDYTATSSATVPTLNISRRKPGLIAGSMPDTTYTIGTHAVEGVDVYPRLDLEVSRVALSYVTQAGTTGMPTWAAQYDLGSSAANASAYTPGKRQIIAISRPEASTAASGGGSTIPSFNLKTDWVPSRARIIDSTPLLKSTAMMSNYNGDLNPYCGIGYYIGNGQNPNGTVQSGTAFSVMPPGYYTAAAPTGYSLVPLNPGWPDWVSQQYTIVRNAYYGSWLQWQYSAGFAINAPMQHLIDAGCEWRVGYWQSNVYAGNDPIYIVKVPVWFDCVWINTPATNGTTIYQNLTAGTSNYAYSTPPRSLAANLLLCQNWVPYEGTITIVADVCSGDNLCKNKVNVGGSLPVMSTMGTMTRGCTHDLMRGRTVIDLGTPARTDYGSLVARVRRDAQDYITRK